MIVDSVYIFIWFIFGNMVDDLFIYLDNLYCLINKVVLYKKKLNLE